MVKIKIFDHGGELVVTTVEQVNENWRLELIEKKIKVVLTN